MQTLSKDFPAAASQSAARVFHVICVIVPCCCVSALWFLSPLCQRPEMLRTSKQSVKSCETFCMLLYRKGYIPLSNCAAFLTSSFSGSSRIICPISSEEAKNSVAKCPFYLPGRVHLLHPVQVYFINSWKCLVLFTHRVVFMVTC